MNPTFSYSEALDWLDHLTYVEEVKELIDLLEKEKRRYPLTEIQAIYGEINKRFGGMLQFFYGLTYHKT